MKRSLDPHTLCKRQRIGLQCLPITDGAASVEKRTGIEFPSYYPGYRYKHALSPVSKANPAGTHPILALIVTYIPATIACLILLPAFPLTANLRESLKGVNWVSIALGVTIVSLELGYLLAYRAGWNISIAGKFSNPTVALLLIPIGIASFNEKLSAFNLAGILFCTLGLVSVNWKIS